MEKRHFTRVPFAAEATVRYGDVVLRGKVENLSLQGMLLRTPERVPVHEELDIKIFLSGTSSELSISLKGQVVREDRDALGFRFDGMDLDSFIHLRNIIAYNKEDGKEVMDEFFEYMGSNRSQQ